MSDRPGYHNRNRCIGQKINSLLISLTKEPSKYDEITPKIEYWIEYVIREDFSTVDELVEGVSYVAWEQGGSFASVGKFLKEFRDAPHRSEQARTFVTRMCSHVLRWFAIASAEDLYTSDSSWNGMVAGGSGGPGFIRAASFVGYLIESGLLSHELVQRHLIKSLINHQDNDGDWGGHGAVRSKAIYELFTAAGNTLLQGLLEPDDVQVCFHKLNLRYLPNMGFDAAKLKVWCTVLDVTSRWTLTCEQEFREIHAAWIQRKGEQGDPKETEEHQGGGEEDTVAADVSAEVKTPVAFVPQDLPTAAIGIEIPSSILQDIGSAFTTHDTTSSSDTIIEIPASSVSSPAMSISTMSDLTPTELDDIENGQEEATSQETFYFEDGNVEVACGDSTFRVHSTIVSFSSSKLRETLSRPALLKAPTPEGCPRITVSDSAEDFAMLLKMIYTPG
jgi:hypothetical protein